MVTATGPIDWMNGNLLGHRIDANRGQSGSGLESDGLVFGVHVFGGSEYDGARRIDSWWKQVLQSNL